MAITTSSIKNGNGISYTVITDNSADWNNVANNTYFYNIADSLIYFKNNSGTVYSAYDNSVSRYVSISNANSPYTATTANEIIEVTGSLTGPITINLYSAVNNAGRTLYIKNNSTNNTSTNFVTIDADGSQTIDGQLTRALSSLEELVICSNGANWIMLNTNPTSVLFQHAVNTTLLNNTTYYIGSAAGIEPSTSESVTRQVIVPKSGWIRTVNMVISQTNSAVSSSPSIFRLRNSTTSENQTISLNVVYTPTAQNNNYPITPLHVKKGDFLTVIWETPNWTTQPANTRHIINALIE
jgi:hypothetical protein